MAISTGMGVLLGGALAAGGSIVSSGNQRKAVNDQNRMNKQIADESNRNNFMQYLYSRGAPMGASLEEMMALPFLTDADGKMDPDKPNPAYNEELSLFDPDGGAKQSAVMPLYLSELEEGMADTITEKYDALKEYYDPYEEAERLNQYRDQLEGTEQSMVDTVNNLYSGQELAQTQEELAKVHSEREKGITAQAQAILTEGQRNAAAQDYTGRSGIVGNSGNAQAATLNALMGAYTRTGQNAADVRARNATENFAAYESDLAKRSDFSRVPAVLEAISAGRTAGIKNAYAPELAASDALASGGYLMGQGRAPAYNTPSYTSPKAFATNPFSVASDAIGGALSGYMLANALGGNALTPPAGATFTASGTQMIDPYYANL